MPQSGEKSKRQKKLKGKSADTKGPRGENGKECQEVFNKIHDQVGGKKGKEKEKKTVVSPANQICEQIQKGKKGTTRKTRQNNPCHQLGGGGKKTRKKCRGKKCTGKEAKGTADSEKKKKIEKIEREIV